MNLKKLRRHNPRGRLAGQEAGKPQARARRAATHGRARRAEPALVDGLRQRPLHRRAAVQAAGGGRRLQPRMPGPRRARHRPWTNGGQGAPSLSGARVARELDAIIAVRGKPATVVSDNDEGHRPNEFTSTAILTWCQRTKVDWRPPWASGRWRPQGEPSRRASRHETRLRRELQRQAPRRTPERDAVQRSPPCPDRGPGLAEGLQHLPPALGPGKRPAGRVRRADRTGREGRVARRHQPQGSPHYRRKVGAQVTRCRRPA
jgi:hypothetical protein